MITQVEHKSALTKLETNAALTDLDLKALELCQAAVKVEDSITLLDELAFLLAGRQDHGLTAPHPTETTSVIAYSAQQVSMALPCSQLRPSPYQSTINNTNVFDGPHQAPAECNPLQGSSLVSSGQWTKYAAPCSHNTLAQVD
jgi:hypothetical protein